MTRRAPIEEMAMEGGGGKSEGKVGETAGAVAEQQRSSDRCQLASHSLHAGHNKAMRLTITEEGETDGTSGDDGGQKGVAREASIAGDAALRELGDRLLVVLIDETHYGVRRRESREKEGIVVVV